jgi:2-oxo-4-hydroxy-4-carboxy-5-ureidoimidazoline decarboxylase
MTIAELNNRDCAGFVAAVGHVCEDSPWVAERASRNRPFGSFDDLCDSMNAEIANASYADQLALLRAHPDLGTRARIGESSTREQTGAGLANLTPDEYDRLQYLNAQYKKKFGFPFLYAVKGSDKLTILAALEARLQSDEADELAEALRQVFRIVRFRLEEIIE